MCHNTSKRVVPVTSARRWHAAPWEILRPPLNIENAVRRKCHYRVNMHPLLTKYRSPSNGKDRVLWVVTAGMVGEGRVGGQRTAHCRWRKVTEVISDRTT